MKNRARISLLLLAFVMLVFNLTFSAFAQDGGGVWGEVVNPDGSINYANLTDGGFVSQPADWMPNIPGFGQMEAEYHVYTTPSGNTVVMPTNTTLFFMALNPSASGYDAAAGQLGTGQALMIEMFAGAFPENPLAQSDPQSFFQSIVNGQTDIWSLNPLGMMNFLSDLAAMATGDGVADYNVLLLYALTQCASTPGGCTAEQLALLLPPPPPTQTPPPELTCPSPNTQQGDILTSGQKLAPAYPLVVGQDPDKRGVDVTFSASVEPTIYTYWTKEPVYECAAGANNNGSTNCTKNGVPGHKVQAGWECAQHTETYNECIVSASASLTLSQASRDWILNELSIRYPGAYLHHPSFSVPGGDCAWSASKEGLPIADPGNWDMSMRGRTSGTPVTSPRSFSEAVGTFEVWLKETAIIK